ncbi:ADP-ribosylation factor-like protein [Promethearchaeum syntrophicum]|uniref:ADP-ribosylation factor-like protein n=1 Tax=Promethearchaeum syntrophicum TaxID=2594042 RepID=A0A5B9DC40_9ARCH|nr:ADP-ribosylation factor-like protein [Candidatus Prometheoarchaeum syntrophicum]QEE16778.1 ADP-ribosylation factor family protein [Candidatus Prometheoarchaeum syntrophicum]
MSGEDQNTERKQGMKFRINKNGDILLKIVYWGCAGSGKTTAVDTLFKLVEEGENNIEIITNLKKIDMKGGSTLYFDRGVFRSKIQEKIYYHIYTVAGQVRFSPLRKKVFEGTNAIIFVFDSQRSRIDANINSLKELKKISGNRLISEIPMLVMVNKQDLPNPLTKSEMADILRQEGLYYPIDHSLNTWNPIIYETIALYKNSQNIYTIFSEMLRRISQYVLKDRTDFDNNSPNLPKDVPDL